MKLSDRNPHMLAALGNTYAAAGCHPQAEDIISELKNRASEGYVPPYNIAMVYAGLGQKDEAFAWLERAFEDRSIWLIFLNVHPMFDDLHTDARFKALVRRMGLDRTA